jgi:mono/diheme cytochrome c family protein
MTARDGEVDCSLKDGDTMAIEFLDRFATGIRAAMKAVCAVVVLLSWALPPAVAQLPAGPGQNVLAGSRLFGAMGCAGCHAIDGVGGAVGPDLGRPSTSHSYYGFAAAMWNHLPQMVQRMNELEMARPRLDPWEAGDLIAFLVWLDYFDPPGDVENGRLLVAEKRCLVCHQVDGVGGVAGPDLEFLSRYGSPIQIATAMWNHGPAMTEEMQAKGIERPSFTSSELTDLITYLESGSPEIPTASQYVLPGRPDEGRQRFVDRGCSQCHSVRGEAGMLGPDLGRMGRHESMIDFAAAMWNKAPTMLAAIQRSGMSVPRLNAADMADLVAYLSSVRYFGEAGNPTRGARRVRDKGCLDCHSVQGGGGGTAGDLAQTRGLDSPAAVIAALWNHALLREGEAGQLGVSWRTFSTVEMADLSAFLQTLGREN